jgi:hypothetical protein
MILIFREPSADKIPALLFYDTRTQSEVRIYLKYCSSHGLPPDIPGVDYNVMRPELFMYSANGDPRLAGVVFEHTPAPSGHGVQTLVLDAAGRKVGMVTFKYPNLLKRLFTIRTSSVIEQDGLPPCVGHEGYRWRWAMWWAVSIPMLLLALLALLSLKNSGGGDLPGTPSLNVWRAGGRLVLVQRGRRSKEMHRLYSTEYDIRLIVATIHNTLPVY